MTPLRFTLPVALLALAAASGLQAQPTTSGTDPAPAASTVVGWVSRPVFNSNVIPTSGGVIYMPRFVSRFGYGGVSAFKLTATGSIEYVKNAAGQLVPATPWSSANATAMLEKQDPNTGRFIVTRDANGTPVPFTWGKLSVSQRKYLGDDTWGPQALAYLRGDRSLEAPTGTLRKRAELLGDVVHSSLIHWIHRNGAKRLYFGANDGMLHVLDAATGQEKYAYIPSMLLPSVARMTSVDYEHRYLVDGPLAMTDLRKSDNTTITLLAGGLGAGGKGLFGLDVSTTEYTSEDDAANAVLWEITPASTGFANLGYTYASPVFTRLNGTDKTPAVVVGNGYFSTSGKASLYVINALTGQLIKEIDTGTGTTTQPNGLSTPTLVDTNGDRLTDFAYAGDLQGKLWRFDLPQR